MLDAQAITHGYHRQTPVLQDISVRIASGRVLAILGPNGAGKTTLLRVLAGLATPWRGTVHLSESRLDRMTPARRAKALAYVAQRTSVASAFTVREVVALGRHALPPSEAAIDRALEAVNLGNREHDVFWRLSAGQQQRASLARALAQLDGAGVLLADEPFAALDPSQTQGALDALKAFASTGGGVGVVMHDLTTAVRFADDVALLAEDGRLAASGPASQILTPATLERVFGAAFERIDAAGGPAILPRPLSAPSATDR